MPPGHQLDRLVALRLVQLTWRSALGSRPKGWFPAGWPEGRADLPEGYSESLPPFSTDPALARRLLRPGAQVAATGTPPEPWTCEMGGVRASGATEAHAICRAALLAAGIEHA